ncbi:MAG: molybdate ABC transporter substrate-binding protein [Bryobacteraceae bacterium]|nr:molybdate ABC transporter substrate-binding protein [Bryobacteraceae bacterium]
MMQIQRFWIGIFLSISSAVGSCELLIAAASDLSSLESELIQALPDCKVRIAFGSSGTLARQIRSGADFDVYLAANKGFVTDLVRDRKADASSVTPYARGRVAFWSRDRLQWPNLSSVRYLALANPDLAPYGLAARQALERSGLWKQIESRVVYGESIRQAWQFARSGNADAAIVSWSLVRSEGGELLPATLHDLIEQTGVIPQSAGHPREGRRFLKWLVSPAGQKIVAASGLEAIR